MRNGLIFGYFLLMILALTSVAEVQAAMVTKTVEYRYDGTVLNGYLAYDDAVKWEAGTRGVGGARILGVERFCREKSCRAGGRPGLRGPGGGHVRAGVGPGNRGGPGNGRARVRGTPLIREGGPGQPRGPGRNTGPGGPPAALAAMGFCFGGTTVLELAYSRRRPPGRGELSRRLDHARSRGTEVHQGRLPGAARG